MACLNHQVRTERLTIARRTVELRCALQDCRSNHRRCVPGFYRRLRVFVLPPFQGAAECPHFKASPSSSCLRGITGRRWVARNAPNTHPIKPPNRNGKNSQRNGIRWRTKPPGCRMTLRTMTVGRATGGKFLLFQRLTTIDQHYRNSERSVDSSPPSLGAYR